MAQNAIIDLQTVRKTFTGPAGPIHALKDVSIQVYPGEFVGVRGPSGSGKSTLINMITGIDRPTNGDVHVTGAHLNNLSENELARWRGKNVGVIFQFFQLLPTLTVMENIILPMDFCRVWKSRERPERAMHLLDQVGLADQAHKLPNTLSGGQQQRAAIARALANDPPLVMGDEPTGNLDSSHGDEVMKILTELNEAGTTIIMVTHSPTYAEYGSRTIHLFDGHVVSENFKEGFQTLS